MRGFVYVLIAGIMLVSSCRDGDSPVGPENDKLTGTWILTKERMFEKENGVVCFEDSTIYTTSDHQLLAIINADAFTLYHNVFDENTIVEERRYSVSDENKIKIQGMLPLHYLYEKDETDYKIVGNTLVLSQQLESYTTELFLEPYSGNTPPAGWPSISNYSIPSDATKISTNGLFRNGKLIESGRTWYSFAASSGKTYVLETTALLSEHYLNLYGEISGTDLLSQIFSHDSKRSKVTWKCEKSGTYYFEVLPNGSDALKDYVISANLKG